LETQKQNTAIKTEKKKKVEEPVNEVLIQKQEINVEVQNETTAA